MVEKYMLTQNKLDVIKYNNILNTDDTVSNLTN